jgi:hypothetical protein
MGQEQYGAWAAGLDQTTVARALLAFGVVAAGGYPCRSSWAHVIFTSSRGPSIRHEPPQPDVS